MNFTIERVYTFKDLGVLFDTELTFEMHIESITSKAKSKLGMIKRWSKEFNNMFITKTLFVSLVRSTLEFASSVWDPTYICHNAKIESIQKQFLLFLLNNLHWNDRLHLPSYEHRLYLVNMNRLEDRRCMLNAVFASKLLNGHIDCPNLLSSINISAPARRTRAKNYRICTLNFNRTNYLNDEPFRNIQRDFNKFYHFFDFNVSNNIFKKNVLHDFTQQQRLPVVV